MPADFNYTTTKARVDRRVGEGVIGLDSTGTGRLFAVDHANNAVLSLACQQIDEAASTRLQFAHVCSVVAGGNQEPPSSSASPSVWCEGTAARVTLWAPTFGIFLRGAFVFMNGGVGGSGKVLLLNDLHPMVDAMLPAVLATADAFALSRDSQHHAACRLHAGLQVSHTATRSGWLAARALHRAGRLSWHASERFDSRGRD